MFFKNKKFLTVVIIIIVCFTLINITAKNRNSIRFFDNVIAFATRPFSKAASAVSNAADASADKLQSKKELIAEKEELEKKVIELEKKNAEFQAMSIENDRLRSLLELKSKTPNYELAACNAYSNNTSNYYSSFFIDIGKNDGMMVGLPVIGSKGLIGSIIEVGSNWARVRTIIDGGSAVGCVVTRTQATAVAEGNNVLLPDGLLSMIFVSKEMNLVEGDIIETSGLGQIYPPGIAIGRVSEITSDTISKSQYATITPFENFDSLNEVFVIKSYIAPTVSAENDIAENNEDIQEN